MKLLVLIISILYFSNSFARDTWIQVVGLGEDIDHNFFSFYESANYFLKNCEQKKEQVDCILLLDQSIQIEENKKAAFNKLKLPKTEAPTKKLIFSLLEKLFLETDKKDKIILNFSGHGTPDKKIGNSCMIINEEEKICENDLAEILKKRPKDLKIFINAEGCFSGGFTELSEENVCVGSRVDRRSAAISAGGFFWEQLFKQHQKTLFDFNQNIGFNYTQKPIIASVAMKSIMCRKFREQNYHNWPAPLSFMSSESDMDMEAIEKNTDFYSQYTINEFQDDSTIINYPKYWLNRLIGFNQFLDEARNFDCKNEQFGKSFCRSLNYFLGNENKAKISELMENAVYISETKGKTQLKYISLFKKLFREWYSGKLLSSWNEIEPCFYNIEGQIDSEEMEYYNHHRFLGNNFPREYSLKDIVEAKRCEMNFSF